MRKQLNSILIITSLAAGYCFFPSNSLADTPNDSAGKFVEQAAQGGMTEVKVGILAKEKATTDELRKFGEVLQADHTKANEDLKQIAKEQNLQLPDDVSIEQKSAIEKLSALSGKEFDKAFVTQMLTDHRSTVTLFQGRAATSEDPQLQKFAQSTLPTLKHHLDMAEALATKTQ